jgi:AcrR family transcriptional regulator
MPDTRGHILDAATELFARKGYDATSIRDIAERADVAPGLIHHHFGNKSTLLLAVCERLTAWTKEQRQVRSQAMADASLDDRIEGYVRDTFEMACLRPDYTRLIGMAMYSQEIWDDAELGELVWSTLAFNLAKIVEEYVDAYPDLGMPIVMHAGIGIFGACLIRFVITPDGDEVAKDEGWHERKRTWCEAMTRIWTGQLLPHRRPARPDSSH